MRKFIEWYGNIVDLLISETVKEHKKKLSKTKGFIDVKDKEQEITDDLIDDVLLKNEKIQKIDQKLESIMSSYNPKTDNSNNNNNNQQP